VIDAYNNRYHHGVKGVPNVLYQQERVELNDNRKVIDEPVIPSGTSVRKVVDHPNTEHTRGTDPRWSREVYMVGLATRKSNRDPYKYKLLSGTDLAPLYGSFYREELLVVDDVKKLGGFVMKRFAAN
jgi:hypothetical protein